MLSSQFGANTDAQLWRMRLGDRSAAMPLAQAMVAGFEAGSLWHGVGLFHRAWCHLSQMDEAACVADLAQAQACFERQGDRARAADCIDVRAQLLWVSGGATQALKLLDTASAMAGPARSAMTSYLSMNLRGLCEWDGGDWDGALRSLTRAILLAEQSDSPQCLSNALANCAGFHYDMFNFELARDLSSRAWQVAQGHSPTPAQTSIWWTAGINAMLALDGLGEHASAWAIAQTLLAQRAQMPPRKSVSYFSKFAFVALHAGAVSDAQDCIAQAVHLCGDKPPITELVWAQALAGVMQQDFAQARALAEARVEAPEQAHWADTPLDIWRMLRTLADACKGMKDYEAALRYEERASERYGELVGRSARANRVAIEVELETQRTAWQRDEALRMHREAQAEQQRLAALNAALDEASRAKTRLLAVASHDLRQPLHALGMYVASLHADLSARADMPAQIELLERAEETVNSLGSMFGTLLDLSRLEGGGLQVHMQSVNLDVLCQRLAQEASARRATPVRLLRAKPAAQPVRQGPRHGFTDPSLLERCLRNLLENAIHYAPGAALCIAIRGQGRQWRIEVRDAGPGIAPQHQKAVFDEFYRIDQRQHTVRGLGLGLSIVKRLCELMQHALALRSREGAGTVVSIAVGKSDAPASPRESALGLHARGKLRVALIDDDPAVREGTAALLTRLGYAVDCAADASPWLHPESRLPAPDAAVVDYHLGAMTDGLSAMGALRQVFGASLPGLIVSAETSPGALGRIQASGLPCLAKPMQPARLRAWLAGVESAARGAVQASAEGVTTH